jgi:hypothetical protein
MGYGTGAFLLAAGLVLALAVTDHVNGVDLTMVGWILTGIGALVIVLTALTMGGMGTSRRQRRVAATTYPDGSQTVQEERHTNF